MGEKFSRFTIAMYIRPNHKYSIKKRRGQNTRANKCERQNTQLLSLSIMAILTMKVLNCMLSKFSFDIIVHTFELYPERCWEAEAEVP